MNCAINIFCQPSPLMVPFSEAADGGLFLSEVFDPGGLTLTLNWAWSGANPVTWNYQVSNDGGNTWGDDANLVAGNVFTSANFGTDQNLVRLYGIDGGGAQVTPFSNAVDTTFVPPPAPDAAHVTDDDGNALTDDDGNILTADQ